MSSGTLKPDASAGPIRRALWYAFYDWTREMSRSKRLIALLGLGLQGYVIYAVLMWVIMPKQLLGYMLVLPKGPLGYLLAFLFYVLGFYIMNGMLTSEFLRKTQLEADQLGTADPADAPSPEAGRVAGLQGGDLLQTFSRRWRRLL